MTDVMRHTTLTSCFSFLTVGGVLSPSEYYNSSAYGQYAGSPSAASAYHVPTTSSALAATAAAAAAASGYSYGTPAGTGSSGGLLSK